MPARSRLEQYDHLMGECTDQAIAELADCSTEAVRRRRLKIGKDRFALAESTPLPFSNINIFLASGLSLKLPSSQAYRLTSSSSV